MGKMFAPTHSMASNTSDLMTTQTSSSEFQILSPPNSTQVNGIGNPNYFRDLQVSLSSAVVDLSPDEIQDRLRDIIRENGELKETLHENNVAMNEQFERLIAWQQEVKQQKVKFDETRTIIEKLHKENVELHQQIKQFQNKENEANNSIDEFELISRVSSEKDRNLGGNTSEIDRLTIINLQLQSELKELKEKLERANISKNHLIREKEELLATNQQLQTQISSPQLSSSQQGAISKQNKLGYQDRPAVNFNTVGENIYVLTNQESGVRELLLQLHSEQEKSSALMAELMEERKSKSLLTTELTNLKAQLETTKVDEEYSTPSETGELPLLTMLGERGTNKMQELNETKLQFAAAGNQVEEYQVRCSGLEVRLADFHDRIQSLKSKDDLLIAELRTEIEDLRKVLTQEKKTNEQDKQNLVTAQRQFESLLADYQQLLHFWENFEQDQNNKGAQSTAYYEIQVKSLKEEIDRLTAQLVANEETLSSKMTEINQLKLQLKASVQELEKMSILQAQVDVYQTDFRMEREAREKLQQENETITRQLRELETHRQRLNENVETRRQNREWQTRDVANFSPAGCHCRSSGIRENEQPVIRENIRANPVEVRRSESIYTRNASPAENKRNDLNVYICPKCQIGFTELRSLEVHVNYCLDNEDSFF